MDEREKMIFPRNTEDILSIFRRVEEKTKLNSNESGNRLVEMDEIGGRPSALGLRGCRGAPGDSPERFAYGRRLPDREAG